jgi:Cellulose binding domain
MQPRRLPWRASLAVIAAVSALTLVLSSTLPAGALTVTETPAPVTGNTTYFDGLGQPYGGCGLPQANLDSPNFVALNVYDTPGDYSFYPRPLTGANLSKLGMWNNGHNCGRWIQVTVGDYCTGVNDGAPNQAFCRNGGWTPDAYNGATLTMLVADSCGDANAWCRDDPYHIDLAKDSLNRFLRNGTPVGDLYPNHFNNRRMSWQFIPAPNYSGDIQVGFLQGAQVWWPAISVSHLSNGIHSVEYLANGVWQTAQMNGDMGQSFILGGTTSGANQFQIRVRDVTDALINNGRVYSFTLPASCGSSCPAAYTQVSYTTSNSTASPTATVTPTASPTVTPTATPSVSPTATPTPTPTATAGGRACAATYTVTGQWSGGFQAEVAVRNTGASALTGWRVSWTFANGQTISQLWNGTLTASGAGISVANVGYNGSVPVNGSTTFGFLGAWTGTNAVPVASCTPV